MLLECPVYGPPIRKHDFVTKNMIKQDWNVLNIVHTKEWLTTKYSTKKYCFRYYINKYDIAVSILEIF